MDRFPGLVQELAAAHQAALAVRSRAHAPYSSFLVGAALKVSGQPGWVLGCNVENASFGATLCAERTALCAAVAAGARPGDLAYLVLVTAAEPPAVPCGMCLQVLAEFCPPDFPIHLGDLRGLRQSATLADFLPRSFTRFSPAP